MTDAPASQDIALYTAPDGAVQVDVRVDADTVWLTQKQLADLFDVNVRTVNEHLMNVYAEGELQEGGTIRNFRIVRREGAREVSRDVKHYNLDAIISVGYRVNSKRGTHFRIWATRTLRDQLIKGYSLNERRLKQRGLADLEQTVQLLGRTLRTHKLVSDEGAALLDVVGQYARSWRILLQYDENRLPAEPAHPTRKMARLTVAQANQLIMKLRKVLKTLGAASDLFGAKRGEGLEGVLGAIEQTLLRSMRASRRAPPTCSTSSSRITRSPTATSASAACCSSTSSTRTGVSPGPTGDHGSTTGPWSPSLC